MLHYDVIEVYIYIYICVCVFVCVRVCSRACVCMRARVYVCEIFFNSLKRENCKYFTINRSKKGFMSLKK